jgi:hypothetical protein
MYPLHEMRLLCLTHFQIASVLEHDKFVEFQELRSNVLLKMNPACRYCPRYIRAFLFLDLTLLRPDCGHPQIGNPAVVHMVCDLCQYEYCFNCRDKVRPNTARLVH